MLRGDRVTNLNRWKLACALFAALAGYGVVSAHRAHDHNAPASSVITPRGAAVPFALRKPIHVAPEACGGYCTPTWRPATRRRCAKNPGAGWLWT